jgi:hypothetical protein
MFKTIAIITAIALTTTACTHGPQQTYKNYAKKVNQERKDLNLKNWQWSPTEIKVMGPVVAIAGAYILIAPAAGAGANCAAMTAAQIASAGLAPAPSGKFWCQASGF